MFPRLSSSPASRVALSVTVGLAWGFRSVLALGHPVYWEPATALDWVAVVSYSVALMLLALAMVVLPELAGRRRAVQVASWFVAIAALVTAVANLAEDAFDLSSFGAAFVGGALALFGALLVLAVILAAARPRALALVPLATLMGIGTMEAGGGALVLVAWLAVAVLAWRRSRPSAHVETGLEHRRTLA